VKHIQEIINMYTVEFKQIPRIDSTLANRYQQKLEDIREWLQITEWSQKQLPESTLKKIQDTLKELDLIDKSIAVSKILN
jgi:chaperonin cofactor prefoldin